MVPEKSKSLIIKTMWKKPSTLTNANNNLSSTSLTKGSDTSSTISNIIPPSENYVKSEQNSMKMSPTSKTMNPIEIVNMTEEDASSTLKLPIKNYEKGNKESKFYKNITNVILLY